MRLVHLTPDPYRTAPPRAVEHGVTDDAAKDTHNDGAKVERDGGISGKQTAGFLRYPLPDAAESAAAHEFTRDKADGQMDRRSERSGKELEGDAQEQVPAHEERRDGGPDPLPAGTIRWGGATGPRFCIDPADVDHVGALETKTVPCPGAGDVGRNF